MFPASLLSTILFALAVAANPIIVERPPVTLSLSRKVNVTSIHHLLRHDQNRAKALMSLGRAKEEGVFLEDAVVNEQVDNQAVSYIASVGVGSPPTIYSLLVDTGSSNTWVGANKAYVKTSTSTQTSSKTFVSYGSGSFSGTEFTDQVTLASGLVIPKQSIGVASKSTGFDGVDGILGLGPVGLTSGAVFPNTGTIPTVTDNLFKNGVISANTLGISFQPTTQNDVMNGELTWGGTDSSKFTGSINFTPLTTTSPASQFWGIDQSIRYGASTNILSSTAGIVDTGTTLVLIATDAFNRYSKATGAVSDSTTGLLRLTSAQFANLQSLFFTTGGVSYELTANAQIWPRSLNSVIGGTPGNIYLIIGDLGSNSGNGLDFINGYAFLERFYSVYDTANKRVGFATTPFTTAITN